MPIWAQGRNDSSHLILFVTFTSLVRIHTHLRYSLSSLVESIFVRSLLRAQSLLRTTKHCRAFKGTLDLTAAPKRIPDKKIHILEPCVSHDRQRS